jgi:Ca-activated chloride channel family protein
LSTLFPYPTLFRSPIKDENGKFTGYKKDKNGNVVMSKMDESVLVRMAEITGGRYFDASSGQVDIIGLIDAIKGLEKSKLSSSLNRQYEDRYQYLLFFGLLFLIIECFIPETKKRNRKTDN